MSATKDLCRASSSASVGLRPPAPSLCSSPTSLHLLSKAAELLPPGACHAHPSLHSTMLVSGLLPQAREGSGCPSCTHSFSLNASRVLLSTHEMPKFPARLGPRPCPCEILCQLHQCDTWEFVIKYSPQVASLELWSVKRFTWLITFFKKKDFPFYKVLISGFLKGKTSNSGTLGPHSPKAAVYQS